VIDQAPSDGIIVAVPVERSGRDWFELEWGREWLAIGRSIRENPISGHNHGHASEKQTADRIAERYLGFARRYCAASGAAAPP